MDVRCEKCQTEYELDEARLKPGGVTVKCTNCGHMFKIRKRSNTNVGVPTVVATPPSGPSGGAKSQANRADSILSEEAASTPLDGERQWLIRLENGEQKSCRELAMLQQWIVGGVVTRESLISRTGKTWKRLGDIAELAQYFTIADEARNQRGDRATKPTPKPPVQQTMLGMGATAAGGTILPDDDDARSTGNFSARPGSKPTPPPPVHAPPKTEAAPRRPITQPPPPPPKKKESQSGPLPKPDKPAPSIPISNRSTAAWATEGVSPTADTQKDEGPSGPFGGRVKAAATAEPAFAGRVRVVPGDEAAFQTGKVQTVDDDDDLLPQRRGSRGGTLLVVMALLVMGVAAGVVYVFVIKKSKTDETTAKAPADAAVVAVAPDAAVVAPATPDAAVATPPAQTPVDLARAELGSDLELKLRDALKALEGAEPAVETMRAHLGAQIAQGLYDRAAITADKSEADKLKKAAKQLVIDAATSAQRAFKAAPADPGANLAMAEVLRLQDKPAKDVQRYLETAKAKQTDEWKHEIALAEGLLLARDKKFDEAKTQFATIDNGAEKLEASGDVRARFHLALVTYAQNSPADAKPLVEQVLAAQPEHAGAKALAARIETTVSKVDPLPPEDGSGAGSAKMNVPTGPGPNISVGAGDTYDSLLAKANKLAESNCAKATELFGKALEQKPNGVEALTGMGYCHIDAKQFASAFSKFRAALAISSRYEPALWGVAEAYMQQGRKEQALEAVKAYLEVYPGTAKATKALDRLGGSSTPEKPPEKPPEGSGSTPPPPPPPTPTPETGAGSGSG